MSAVALAVVALGVSGCIPSASVSGTVLTITASGGPDVIALRLKAGAPSTLEVDDGNDGAARFWTRLGFAETARLDERRAYEKRLA